MQYQVTCNHCHQLYVVEAKPGATVRSRCPYCGMVSTIATPLTDQQQAPPTPSATPQSPHRPVSAPSRPLSQPTSSSLTRRVVVGFVVVAVLLVVVASLLYMMFSHLSQ